MIEETHGSAAVDVRGAGTRGIAHVALHGPQPPVHE